MTFDDFIKKYSDKPTDFDGAYGSQCVDLYRYYLRDVLQVPQSPPVKSAKDIWNTYNKEDFERIKNTPDGVPQKGDVVIWGNGEYGHVGIFVDGNTTRFRSFDTNYPAGTLAHIQGHTYANVLGWLRPRGGDSMDCDEIRKDRDLNWQTANVLADRLGKPLDPDNKIKSTKESAKEVDRIAEALDLSSDSSVDTIVNSIKGTKTEAETTRRALKAEKNINFVLREEISRLEERTAILTTERDDALKSVEDKERKIDEQSKTILSLQEETAELKQGLVPSGFFNKLAWLFR
jgi:hypothetical protein